MDRVDWNDRPRTPKRTTRTDIGIEDTIIVTREELRTESDLGEFGAVAIRREMTARGLPHIPSVRTINRILARRGAFDGDRRIRRPAPPKGWYIPQLASGEAELDSFDLVEGLVIEGGTDVEVLNGVAIHGGLPGSWPARPFTSKAVIEALKQHWRTFGLPGYVQFDNDTVFEGSRAKDSIGRVTRMALTLGVTPVFAPPYEHGFQAAIEAYNGRWQQKVWQRFHFDDLDALVFQSARYVAAYRERIAKRIAGAPPRSSFPKRWRLDLQRHPRGTIIFIRRADDRSRVAVMGHRYPLDVQWPHRLVRVEVHLSENRICFFTLRRRTPSDQPLVGEVEYVFPKKRFHE